MIKFDFVMQLVDNLDPLSLIEEVNLILRDTNKMDSLLLKDFIYDDSVLAESAMSMVSLTG